MIFKRSTRNLTLIYTLLFFLSCLAPHTSFGQSEVLRQKIERIIQTSEGEVGIALMHLEGKDTMTVHGHQHFPMQSVYKFPLALAVLHQVDKGKLSLQQKIRLTHENLLPETWSPLREKYPDRNVDVTLEEILRYTVSQSDNNGCDILFGLLGGTRPVHKYVRNLGVKGISIAATEAEMHQDWNVQFTNWCEPQAMLSLLQLFYERRHLSTASSNLLWQMMVETSTGPNRIKGLLPKEAIVAHKTGTSGANAQGISAATNDVGIITLPDGTHLALVVFVSNTKADGKTQEEVIARIAGAVWDHFTKKTVQQGG